MGDMDITAFWRNAGMMQSALESMKGGVRALRSGIQGAARCFVRMGDCAKGVLSALMHSANVVQGLEAGVMNLYRWSRAFHRSFSGTLDGLAKDALYLKNSLAAMTAPLISAIAPAIDFITERFVGLFNLINQVFARLTGSSTYVAAKKTGEAWDAVGGRISRATSALKRYIMGFDQLNILGDGSSQGDSGGGSGGSGGGGGVMFEEREIEAGLASFVDSLKAAFQSADWQTLGTLIGEKVNELVDGIDWAAAGSRVGYYVNALFSTAYWTLETVNFTNIGAGVAEFLNNALAEIDMQTVGGTVALLFTSLAETIAGFIEEFDWVQFAGKMADGINGFVSKLGERLDGIDWAGLAARLTEGLNAFVKRTDWESVGASFGGRVNDLLAILGTAAANFDWKEAGLALATAVNGMVKKVDWDALGRWLNDTLQGVLDFGIAFFQGFDAADFANNVKRALSKVDWDAVSEKLWTLFKAALQKLGEFFGALLFGGSADVKLNLSLLRNGWSTIAAWLGIDKPLSALIGLLKDNWQTIAKWLGIDNPLDVAARLLPAPAEGSSTLPGVFGSFFDVVSRLTGKAEGSNTLTGVYGESFDTRSALKGRVKDSNKLTDVYGENFDTRADLKGKVKDSKKLTDVYGDFDTHSNKVKDSKKLTDVYGDFDTHSNLEGKVKDSKKLTDVYGDKFNAKSKLTGKASGSKTLTGVFGSTFEVTAKLSEHISGLSDFVSSVANKLKDALEKIWNSFSGKAEGGAITNSGREIPFAAGGVIRGGMAGYLSSVPHYAGGTTRAHGTVFVAGEAGPEIMGHINGRTEILNKSQLAQTMYSAVASAMGQAISALGTFLSGQMAACTNAITKTIGNVGGFAGLEYHAPAMASGAVLPYEVAAQVARSGADIQHTLDANNEDLIQTIISVAGQIVAAVQSQGNREQGTGNRNGQGLTAQQLINDINRRTQMFGGSPLLD